MIGSLVLSVSVKCAYDGFKKKGFVSGKQFSKIKNGYNLYGKLSDFCCTTWKVLLSLLKDKSPCSERDLKIQWSTEQSPVT